MDVLTSDNPIAYFMQPDFAYCNNSAFCAITLLLYPMTQLVFREIVYCIAVSRLAMS